jgi:hypothetical protein
MVLLFVTQAIRNNNCYCVKFCTTYFVHCPVMMNISGTIDMYCFPLFQPSAGSEMKPLT